MLDQLDVFDKHKFAWLIAAATGFQGPVGAHFRADSTNRQ